jgi:4-amino-4-deoxy-L-arabinose transferase-like glycosyltransferase
VTSEKFTHHVSRFTLDLDEAAKSSYNQARMDMIRLTRTQTLAVLVLVLLVTAVLRLPNLPTIPPGLHFDEAANALLTGDIAFRDYRPVFIGSYTGKEVLFFYLAAGVMAGVGESLFALRLTAAFIGLLTVAATYWAGCELLRDRRVALLAATILAVSFWHLLFSRLGFRAISQPLLQALMVAMLLRGLRREDWRWLAGAGLMLGLAAYTYLAVRLFPVLLLLACLPLLWYGRRRWAQLGVVGAIALLVAAPLLLYFANNPEAFWVRIGQVAPGGETLTVGEAYWRSLQMFFVQGDPYIRFNWPLRPLFGWFLGGAMVLGWLGVAHRLIWRPDRSVIADYAKPVRSALRLLDWQATGLLLLLLAPFLMILPTALATSEIVPSNLRAIGLIPFIFYLPALGLILILDELHRILLTAKAQRTQSFFDTSLRSLRLGGKVFPFTMLLALLLLVSGGWVTSRLYFEQWANQPEVFFESDGDLTAVAAYLEEQELDDTAVYVSALHYQHPTLAFLSRHYSRIKWLPGSRALVFPAEGPALYVFPYNSPMPVWAASYFDEEPPDPDAPPLAFTVHELAEPPLPNPSHPADANFGHTIRLTGYDVAEAASGSSLGLTLFWEVTGQPLADFTPFVHLEDQWRTRWAQGGTFAYPAAQWTEGERIVQRVDVPLPPGIPPGQYRLRVGLFTPDSGDRLPRLDENGRYAGDAFAIENVSIVAAGELPIQRPEPPQPIYKEVRPGLLLLGYQPGRERVPTGEPLGLTLWWQATQPQPPMVARLELMRPDNTGRILGDTQPVGGTYPFSRWQTPIFLIDPLQIRPSHNTPPGQYRLQLRLLSLDTGESLYTTGLGPIIIETTERTFSPPPLDYLLDARFGNEIQLLGYNLEEHEDERYTLTLAWKALRPPQENYTVFVHLLHSDGACCVWQQDAMPRQNQYPTSRWLGDEVVVDSYEIDLTGMENGRYPLAVGLYLAETGQRLAVTGTATGADDAVFLHFIQR